MADKKQMVVYVPKEFPYTGNQVKSKLNDFFQWVWNFTKAFEKYEKAVGKEKADEVKTILGSW